jgi:hypothetical protein
MVQDLTVGSTKTSFYFDHCPHMSISTYFRPNIHQNGPEILGVKAYAGSDTRNKLQDFHILVAYGLLKGVVPLYLAVSHTKFEHIGFP